MTPPDPSPDRKERMKQILADSYPRVNKEDREPLPKRILAELQGEQARVPAKPEISFLKRLRSLLRGPQALGLGAAAALVVVALFAFLPDRSTAPGNGGGGSGDPLRGPGDTPTTPMTVVSGLSDAQLEALRSSGLFPPEQLEVVSAGRELSSVTKEKQRPQLIVVDGTTGTITMPFYEEPMPPIEFDADTDLVAVLLDLKGELASKEPE